MLDERQPVNIREQQHVRVGNAVDQPSGATVRSEIAERADSLTRQHRVEQFRELAGRAKRMRGGHDSGVRTAVQRGAQLRRDRHRRVGAHPEATLFLRDADTHDADVAQLAPGRAPSGIRSGRAV